ncbi:MAG: hypothetical protein RL376_1661 [Verrucomicrobiota bacterium]
MKFAFLISGVVGFVLTALAGFSADRPVDLVLRDAAVACLITALAGRWFWQVVDRAFSETVLARKAAAEAAAAAAEAAAAAPPAPAPAAATKPSSARPTAPVAKPAAGAAPAPAASKATPAPAKAAAR